MGRFINGIKYICLIANNDFKKKSLEDNVYFTLMDIMINSDSTDTCMTATLYTKSLDNDIYFNDRTDSFEYTNALEQKDYVEKLLTWLKRFTKNGWFEFLDTEEDVNSSEKYIRFDDWWIQFCELRKLLSFQYEKCCEEEKRDPREYDEDAMECEARMKHEDKFRKMRERI